jgi:hypothetical protein
VEESNGDVGQELQVAKAFALRPNDKKAPLVHISRSLKVEQTPAPEHSDRIMAMGHGFVQYFSIVDPASLFVLAVDSCGSIERCA